jgi:hypothetical protein
LKIKNENPKKEELNISYSSKELDFKGSKKDSIDPGDMKI